MSSAESGRFTLLFMTDGLYIHRADIMHNMRLCLRQGRHVGAGVGASEYTKEV